MKYIVLFSLLLAACGVQVDKKRAPESEEQSASLTSSTWCEQDKNRDGISQTYRFYPDGRSTRAQWDGSKNQLSDFYPLSWSLSGSTLVLSAENRTPKSEAFHMDFIASDHRTVMRWRPVSRQAQIILEPCTLTNDPR